MREKLISGAAELGVSLSDSAAAGFCRYFELLEEKNKVMNLTAISGEDSVLRLHFLDSLALLGMLDFKNARVIDVGTGAGFPGLPIKLGEPTAKVTLLDALRKRIDFLSEVCAATGADAECIHARAEEAAAEPDRREKYDYAVSRAVASMNVLCELCLPFVKVGGAFAAMKSVGSDEELSQAASAIKLLGGKVEAVRDYTVPGTDVTHRVIIVRKTAPTPKGYPRRFAKIQKAPL